MVLDTGSTEVIETSDQRLGQLVFGKKISDLRFAHAWTSGGWAGNWLLILEVVLVELFWQKKLRLNPAMVN